MIGKTLNLLIMVDWLLIPDSAFAQVLTIVSEQVPAYQLYLGNSEDEGLQFAGRELQRYIEQISGTLPEIVYSRPVGPAIVVGRAAASAWGVEIGDLTAHQDGFVKIIQPGEVVLAGNSRRATLYAVYDFLEDLGCRWYAPNFEFYGDVGGEHIPRKDTITCPQGTWVKEPLFSLRSKRVEEGWSVSSKRLGALIDWMAKTRLNIFNMTIDYGGRGRVPYEEYRESIVPQIEKRGLLLHVGGHNYSLFLPDSYFEEHPDWFGMNRNGERVPMVAGRVNFNTANPEAVRTFIDNCKQWLRQHPEIDLFSLVPEDSPVWDTSPESRQLGSIPERHAIFANQVLGALKSEFPGLKVMLPAYQALVRPPEGLYFEENALIGFAMIRRDNARFSFDLSSQKNLYYMNYLWQWLDFPGLNGRITLGGYYRRYAWRSLPVLNYSVLASDLKYAAMNGVAGLGEYGEPGDWFTFELLHYLLARLSWDCYESVGEILRDYCFYRFGTATKEMQQLFFLLDAFSAQIVRGFGNYERLDSDHPFPELQVQQIFSEPARGHSRHLELCTKLVRQARKQVESDPILAERVEKWSVLIDYLELELQAKMMTEILSSVSPYGPVLERVNRIYRQMQALVERHEGRGMFLLEDPRMNYAPAAIRQPLDQPRDRSRPLP